MTSKIIEVDETSGWINLTSAMAAQPGDSLNIQNIGAGAVYLMAQQAEPAADLTEINIILPPSLETTTATPFESQNVWVNAKGAPITKLIVALVDTEVTTTPELRLNNNIALLLKSQQGAIPREGFKQFYRVEATPSTRKYAFRNPTTKNIKGKVVFAGSNNANNAFGSLDVALQLSTDAITGGTDFAASDIFLARTDPGIVAKVDPTNTLSLGNFERIYVQANGGGDSDALPPFVLKPNETLFIQVSGFSNINETTIRAAFEI